MPKNTRPSWLLLSKLKGSKIAICDDQPVELCESVSSV
jgi:hypothetical protein